MSSASEEQLAELAARLEGLETRLGEMAGELEEAGGDDAIGMSGGGGGALPLRLIEGNGIAPGVVDKPAGWLYFDKENGGLYASAIFAWQSDRPYALGELARDGGSTYKALEENANEQPSLNPAVWELVVGEPHGTENWVAIGGSTNGNGLGLGTLAGTTLLEAQDELQLSLLNGAGMDLTKAVGLRISTGVVIMPPTTPELLGALLINTPEGWNEYLIKTTSFSGPENHPATLYVTSDAAIHSEGFADQHGYELSIGVRRAGTWTMFPGESEKAGVIAVFSQLHAAGESNLMGYVLTVDAGGGISVWDGETEGAQATEEEAAATGGHKLWWITSDGYEATRNNAPPNNEEIKPGQMFSWYQATDGDAKFIRRGRTFDGTLVEAVTKLL